MGIFFKSKKQKDAEKIGPGLLQTVQECADKVNHSKNPETFFQNYEKMLENLSALAKIQFSLKIKGQLPSDILRTIKDKKPFTIEDTYIVTELPTSPSIPVIFNKYFLPFECC